MIYESLERIEFWWLHPIASLIIQGDRVKLDQRAVELSAAENAERV